MRKWMVILGMLLMTTGLLYAHRGGPDDYGYIFIDDEDRVEFNWIDTIGATSTGIYGDDASGAITLPFAFSYYGETYYTLNASTNGVLSVMPIYGLAASNVFLPSSYSPNGVIAPYWDDGKVIEGEGEILTKMIGIEPERKFVITYLNQLLPYTADTSYLTYQIIIEESTEGDNPIIFQYLDVQCDPPFDYEDNSYGRSATVGIEDTLGEAGLTYLYNDSLLFSGRAIKFFVPPTLEHNIAVSDISLPIIIITDAPFDISIKVYNVGVHDEIDIPVGLDIFGPMGEFVDAMDTVISSLPADSTIEVVFNSFTVSDTGEYTFTAYTTLEGDDDSSNDTLSVELTAYEHISSGGPDFSGYRWYDSFNPDGPTSHSIDIADAVLTEITGDDRTGVLLLPFTFVYYGVDYDSIFVSTNGFASFIELSSSEPSNDIIPDDGTPNAVLAPYWDDMKLNTEIDSESGIYTKTLENEFHIIWYHAFLPYSSEDNPVTFEMVLYADSSILFNYDAVVTPNYPSHTNGVSATVGIESPDGTTGLLYEYNAMPISNPLLDNFAILFLEEELVDTSPPVIVHESPETLFAFGENTTLSATINDYSDIATDSLYYQIEDEWFAVSYDSVVLSTYYYSFPTPAPSSTIPYYFAATDASVSGYRATLPESAPEETFSLYFLPIHTGGPDAGDYRFIDSDAGTSVDPIFEWVELDPTLGGEGTPLYLGDDVLSDPIYLGGYFNFYGVNYDSIRICSNGWATLLIDDTYPEYLPYFPDPELPNAVLSPWWTDLSMTEGEGTVFCPKLGRQAWALIMPAILVF